MLLFCAVAILNGLVLAFVRYRAILPLPTPLLASRLAGAAANAFAEELQFRSIVLGMLLFAGLPGGVGTALVVQALLYGLAHRRLWKERDWHFLARLGAARLRGRPRDGDHRVGGARHGRALRGDRLALRLRRGAAPPATDLRPRYCNCADELRGIPRDVVHRRVRDEHAGRGPGNSDEPPRMVVDRRSNTTFESRSALLNHHVW